MKRIMSVILLTSLMFGICSINAFAASGSVNVSGSTSKEIGVKAKYVDGVSGGEIISIDLSWGAMEFTYNESGSKVWNPSTHEYTVEATSAWSGKGNEIKVSNHSNAQVTTSFSYSKASGYNTVIGSFSKTSLTLPTAEGKSLNDPKLTGEVTFNLSGKLDKSVTELTRVGTITVTIA